MTTTAPSCCSSVAGSGCHFGGGDGNTAATLICGLMRPIGKLACIASRPIMGALNTLFPAFVQRHSHVGCYVGLGVVGLSAYVLYRHLFTKPGFDAPPPGALYLAHGCRRRFEDACDFETDPYVFDVSGEKWTAVLEEKWETIRDELQAYLDKHGGKLAPFGHTHRMSSASCWRVLSLRLWGVTSPDAAAHFPKTMAIVQEAFADSSDGDEALRPVGVTFSQLEPNSDIAPHYGDTNGNYRAHLGLMVPSGLPEAGMQIGDQQQEWANGKIFAFNDAHHHKAWNYCPERRFILIVDVMRKEYMKQRRHLCRYVMASFLLQRIANFKYFGFVKATKWMEYYAFSTLYFLLFIPINAGIGRGFVHWFMRS